MFRDEQRGGLYRQEREAAQIPRSCERQERGKGTPGGHVRWDATNPSAGKGNATRALEPSAVKHDYGCPT